MNETLIQADQTWLLWMVCVICAAIAVGLERTYRWASKITGVIIAMVLAMALSNFRIIPMESPVWDNVWTYVIPLSIPLLLLQCDVKKVAEESGRILILFLIGAAGSACGAVLAFVIFHRIISGSASIAGIFTGTYIGGTVNLAALGASFDVSGEMVSSIMVADNLLMVIYFFFLIAMPALKFFRKHYPHPYVSAIENEKVSEKNQQIQKDGGSVDIVQLAIAIALAFSIAAMSDLIAGKLKIMISADTIVGQIFQTFLGNQYLWITTLAILAAVIVPKRVGPMHGAQELGSFLIYLFFFVIGVPASIPLILKNSPILLLFAAVVVFMNMVFSLIAGKLLGFNLEEIILASNANIGGPTTAVAMAVSQGWYKLTGPILLVGTLGYVIGTYTGLLVGSVLGL